MLVVAKPWTTLDLGRGITIELMGLSLMAGDRSPTMPLMIG